jgi:23S rRNA (adenine2503-C2)-methyltransferase
VSLPVVDEITKERARPSAHGMRVEELAPLLQGLRTSPRAVFSQLHRVANYVDGAAPVARATRARLEQHVDLDVLALRTVHEASDGAARAVFETHDGHEIEAVHMPRTHLRVPRTTLCISSQVGCAMGCTFCATGTMGIVRNLDAGEIVAQVLQLMRHRGPHTGHHLNLVFMGMGEPLHNAAHVQRAIEVLCDSDGVGMSAQRITVSTSGLVPMIERMATWPVRPLLAVSVNATTNATRSAVMPVNRRYPLEQLRACLESYPLRRGEKILVEYVLLRGENDSMEDAQRLAAFAQGFRHNINVIPLNEHALTHHHAPSLAWVTSFVSAVRDAGAFVTVRNNRARTVQGACGQLVHQRTTEVASP